MKLDLKFSQLFYLLGGVFGVISLIYFAFNTIFGLSPIIKSILFILLFFAFLESGYLMKNMSLKVFYLLGIASYLGFVFHLNNVYSLDSNEVFVLLVLSTVLFISLGYFSLEKNISIGNKRLKLLLGITLVSTILLFGFDITGAHPSQSFVPKDQVNLSELNEQNLEVGAGEIEIKNDFFLPRKVKVIDYEVKLFWPSKNGTIGLKIDQFPIYQEKIIKGGETLTLTTNIYIYPGKYNLTQIRKLGAVPIEKVQTFPKKVDEPKILVKPRDT
ncbi:MAG: putative membrane protein [Candidatus Methanohalarchaeum thermophilum]|uniref:Membrane protein n=1 Tax=Methanohalarchaeum thermophilum TaxID=1903181 RepID=A0A1Q6DTX1_METT1|nr:MAG: putative membrane protein [Candidatus Methanohalarchaeum thermophilum]